MPAPKAAPFGGWKSPITTKLVTSSGLRLGEVRLDGKDVYYLEGRPAEAGRSVVTRLTNGKPVDITPEGFNARNRVHEYGGGSYAVHDRVVYFTNWVDQRIYSQSGREAPTAITATPAVKGGYRFADLNVTSDGRFIVCVRERHQRGKEAVNEVVAVATDGGGVKVLASGCDFYSFPRVSPDCEKVAWTCWMHPDMPWDGCELWEARISAAMSVKDARLVAGSRTESIFQPEWSPKGVLHFISDRTGWWNLYAQRDGKAVALAPMDEECGAAQWVFGLSEYAFLKDGTIALAHQARGGDELSLFRPDGKREDMELPYSSIGSVKASGVDVYFTGAAPATAPQVVKLDTRTRKVTVLQRSLNVKVDPAYFSMPAPITFPTGPVSQGKGGVATRKGPVSHALFYPPSNPEYAPKQGEKPPLIVISHGGPTSASGSSLSLSVQFWTSRGFGVVDVNYRGSTGYGRAYREALKPVWGIADVEDCVAAARYLVSKGLADGKRLIIRGGSAGGYTTLCALVFTDVFAAGASYYGVADAETLARDTHKFESRYLDGLIGPYPKARKTYRERSPVHFIDRMSCPLIIFQGLDDEIVPPSQADAMVAALRKKKLPFAYVPFEGEQHGFRKAENISRSLEAELYFYGRVFKFKPADRLKPVSIENL